MAEFRKPLMWEEPEATLDLGDMIEHLVRFPGEAFEITRAGKVKAVVISPDRYDELCAALHELSH